MIGELSQWDTCPDWSDRRIAKHVGVGNKLVAKVKREVESDSTCPAKPRKCKGKDTKKHPARQSRSPCLLDPPPEG